MTGSPGKAETEKRDRSLSRLFSLPLFLQWSSFSSHLPGGSGYALFPLWTLHGMLSGFLLHSSFIQWSIARSPSVMLTTSYIVSSLKGPVEIISALVPSLRLDKVRHLQLSQYLVGERPWDLSLSHNLTDIMDFSVAKDPAYPHSIIASSCYQHDLTPRLKGPRPGTNQIFSSIIP